eukprot:m.55252 g.55252  ORF g.55252 m.55252 type:complete len:60 (-) comp7745_c0_seq3:904-1083(-)
MAVATDRGSDAVGKYSAKNSKMYLIRDAVFDRVGKWVATPLLKISVKLGGFDMTPLSQC